MSINKDIELKSVWLKSCLDFGWSKSDLDGLSAIWDKYKDEHGNMRPVVDESPALPGKVEEMANSYCLKIVPIVTNEVQEQLVTKRYNVRYDVRDAFIAGFGSAGAGDAIGFAEWIRDNFKLAPTGKDWLPKSVIDKVPASQYYKTAAQLYALYPGKKVTGDGVLREALEKMCIRAQELFTEKRNNPKNKRSELQQAWNNLSTALYDANKLLNNLSSHPRPGAQDQDENWQTLLQMVEHGTNQTELESKFIIIKK